MPPREEKGKINSPIICVWTNKPQELTAKAVRMQVKRYLHSMTYNWLDGEGNVGHCSSLTDDIEKEEPNDWQSL